MVLERVLEKYPDVNDKVHNALVIKGVTYPGMKDTAYIREWRWTERRKMYREEPQKR